MGLKPLGVPVPDRKVKGQYPQSGSGADGKAAGVVTDRGQNGGIGDLEDLKIPTGGVNIGKVGR